MISSIDYIHMHATLRPEKRAIVDLGHQREWTYQQLDIAIGQTVTLFAEKGIGKGDRIACLSKNRAEFIILHLACARTGAIFVPMNWRLSAEELHVLFADCEPNLVVYDDYAKQHQLVEAPALEAGIHIDGLLGMLAYLPFTTTTPVDRTLPSLILYTSGTTGLPKGVVLNEANIFETTFNLATLAEVDSDSAFLSEGPMFHIIGIITAIRPVLSRGGQVCICDRFLPERTLKYITNPSLGITHYFCVPQMAQAIRQEASFTPDKLRGMKALFTGGAPHPAAQINQWLDDGIVIVDGYGSSEAGTVFGMPLHTELIRSKAGSVGISTPRIESRLVDDNGEDVAPGEAGELLIRGPNIACGYWQKGGSLKSIVDKFGWFATGDVLEQDKEGFFRVVDRKKDMYISGGENVYPAEVEAILINFPGIVEHTVVGVPDEKWGEVGVLFYVSEEHIELEAIHAFLEPHLARYKLPHHAEKITALPRNSAGKVLKAKLRARRTIN